MFYYDFMRKVAPKDHHVVKEAARGIAELLTARKQDI